MINKKSHFDDLFEVDNKRVFTKVKFRDKDRVFEEGTVFPTGITPGGLDIKKFERRHLNVEIIDDVYEIKGIMAAD